MIQSEIQKLEGVEWRPLLQQAGLTALTALLIGVGGYWLAKLIARLVDRALIKANVEPLSRLFLRNLTFAMVVVLTAVAVLQTLGVPPASLMAMLGAAGLGIGLALKDSLSNIASGVLLVVQKPFQVGDVVEIAKQEGRVTQVRMLVTYLRTLDNRTVAIPNSLVTSQPIVNVTHQPNRRTEITVGVGYGDNLAQAQSALLKLAASTMGVLKDPAPEVIVGNLAEGGVDLILRAWAPSEDLSRVRSELLKGIHDQLMLKELSIPYPQRDLHVHHHNPEGPSAL